MRHLLYFVHMKTFSQPGLYRLTLLWAFAESGLGGVLHGLKIPVTGFVLGAFSVVIISLMARFSSHPYREIMKATALVLAIKFAASPHSPAPAYVAVLFQGFLGACIFQLFRFRLTTVVVFSVLVLVESAVQKPLVATLIFGKELWQAIDALANQVLGFFGAGEVSDFSLAFLLVYCTVYAGWGLMVGVWAYRLPLQLERVKIERNNVALSEVEHAPKKKKWIYWIIAITVIVALMFYIIDMPAPLLYVGRTAALLFLTYGVLGPLVRWLLKKTAGHQQLAINDFAVQLPRLSLYARQAWAFASRERSRLYQVSAFVRYLVYLTLTADEQP
jgi:predicted secreted protein